MQQIVPIRDLKNTSAVSPILNEKPFLLDIYSKLAESESDVAAGRTINAKDSLRKLREKHNV